MTQYLQISMLLFKYNTFYWFLFFSLSSFLSFLSKIPNTKKTKKIPLNDFVLTFFGFVFMKLASIKGNFFQNAVTLNFAQYKKKLKI